MENRSGLKYHRLVETDLTRTLRYYQDEAGPVLADRFYREFQRRIQEAVANPGRFPPVDAGLRRANLRRFPYHFLYRIRQNGITILVLRHDKSHPTRGLSRR